MNTHRPDLVARWNTVADYFVNPMVVATFAAWLWTFVWFGLGMRREHWSMYVMMGLYGVAVVLWMGGFIALRRKNKHSIGNCPFCGGVIDGRPPDDWVMECQHCEQEWVLAGSYNTPLA